MDGQVAGDADGQWVRGLTQEKVQMEKDSHGQTGYGAAPQGLFNRSTAWASLLRAHNQGHLPGGQGQAWLGVGVEV